MIESCSFLYCHLHLCKSFNWILNVSLTSFSTWILLIWLTVVKTFVTILILKCNLQSERETSRYGCQKLIGFFSASFVVMLLSTLSLLFSARSVLYIFQQTNFKAISLGQILIKSHNLAESGWTRGAANYPIKASRY